MPVNPFNPDLSVQALQRAVDDVRAQFGRFTGAVLPSVSIAAGTTIIGHTLGRRWSGYVVTRIRSGTPALLQDATTQPPDATIQLAVTSASAFVADLWVF